MDDLLTYFAYGSNMSRRRLGARVPSARPIAIAQLERHQLAFHKAGRDGSGKCDIVDCTSSVVHGVLYQIRAAEKAALDACEDLGRGYTERRVAVTTAAGERCVAFTYFALLCDASLRPYDWYLRHLLEGAVEHRLPAAYRAALAAIEAIEDPDPARAADELALYSIS